VKKIALSLLVGFICIGASSQEYERIKILPSESKEALQVDQNNLEEDNESINTGVINQSNQRAKNSVVSFLTVCSGPTGNAVKAFEIIEKNQEGLCDYLEDNIVARKVYNSSCETLYHSAIKNKNNVAMKCLENAGFAPQSTFEINSLDNKLRESYYSYALNYGTLDAIKKIKGLGGLYSGNELALVASREDASVKTVEYLVLRGNDVNSVGERGLTPLDYAALDDKKLSILKYLISVGARVNLKAPYDYDALVHAVAGNALLNIRELVKSGADINATNSNGNNAIITASAHANKTVVESLISYGADVNAVNKIGMSSLHSLLHYYGKHFVNNDVNKLKEVIKVLVDAGIDKSALTRLHSRSWPAGLSAYDIASRLGLDAEVLHLLSY